MNQPGQDMTPLLPGYRRIVLDALQQVEDNLVVLRILNTESMQVPRKNRASGFSKRHAGGVDTYLQVVTSQTTALTNERNDIDILRRRLEAKVLLIKAMGGGWDVSQLPQLSYCSPKASNHHIGLRS